MVAYATDALTKSVSLALNEARKHDRSGCLTKQPLQRNASAIVLLASIELDDLQ